MDTRSRAAPSGSRQLATVYGAPQLHRWSTPAPPSSQIQRQKSQLSSGEAVGFSSSSSAVTWRGPKRHQATQPFGNPRFLEAHFVWTGKQEQRDGFQYAQSHTHTHQGKGLVSECFQQKHPEDMSTLLLSKGKEMEKHTERGPAEPLRKVLVSSPLLFPVTTSTSLTGPFPVERRSRRQPFEKRLGSMPP